MCYNDAIRVGNNIIPTSHKIVCYGGNTIDLCGEINATINYNNKSFSHIFLVVKANTTNLFGRDLLTKYNMHITCPVNTVKSDVINEFADYLCTDYKSCVKDTVTLNVLPNAKPIFAKARAVPVRMQSLVNEELNRLVESGIITKVYSSEWASPTVNVHKSSGQVRICGDFSSTVNPHLEAIHTPLHTIDEVIAKVGNATIFSKIDLANAFLQLPLCNESKKYTTIHTSEVLFFYNFLPFGLKASSGLFQSYMLKILNGINNVIVYQDDLLIMSVNNAEHNDTLRSVLNALKAAGVKVNVNKSPFFLDKVKYLGYIFSRNGVEPDHEKIRAIVEAPAPTDIKQLQAFIGMANFYRRFVHKFSDKLSSLYSLLKKDVKFEWGHEQQECFNLFKKIIANHPVLKPFNTKFRTLLETDSSGYGVSAVLFQRENDSVEWHPVEFASRTLNSAERNYSNIEREALSIIFGVEKFKHYLLGGRFTIHNDQQPLKKLLGCNSNIPTTCSARLQRWALRLSYFDYDLEYSRGSINVNSDCLSRLPLSDTVNICEPYELVFTVKTLDDFPVNCNIISEHTYSDNKLSQLVKHIKYGIQINNNSEISCFKSVFRKMSIYKGCILYENRVVIPSSLQKQVLAQFHEGHPGMTAMKGLMRAVVWFHGLDKAIVDLVNSCSICQSVRSKPPKTNLQWPIPSRPWSRVHVDHFFYENKVLFIAVDALSKYIECEIVPSTSVSDTIHALRMIFSRNGLCDVLVSDNASCFTAQQFQYFLKRNDIKHITPPPYSPSSNGQAERGVRVLKDLLKKCQINDSLIVRLANVLLQYRTTPHSITEIPPSISLNNRKYITIKDRVNPKYCQSDVSLKKLNQFQIGDSVLALNLRDGPKWLNATVVEVLGVNTYNVLIHKHNINWKRHQNQLLPVKDHKVESLDNYKTVSSQPLVPTLSFPQNYQIPSIETHANVNCNNQNSNGNNCELRRSVRTRNQLVVMVLMNSM